MTLIGTGTTIRLNGLDFYVHQAGDPKDPAVVLLHGFPDSSDLWREQLEALTQAHYRVIAPDLRGFGRSSKPTKTTDYELPLLIGDVLGILRALNVEQFHLVGHDFGAVLAWLLASSLSLGTSPRALAAMSPPVATALVDARPELLSLTAMSVGHPGAYKRVDLEQREKSWYILFFQFERADGALAAHDYKLLRDWSGASLTRFPRAHGEVDRWVEHFKRSEPGNLRAALNWYRANTHPDRSVADREDFPKIAVRTRGIWGEGDPHQTEAPMKNSDRFVGAVYDYRRLPGAGHWMQLDQKDAFNALLLEWLAK